MHALFPLLALLTFAGQKTFDSPEAAAQAAIDAASKNDKAGLDAIFGPNSKAILSSGDPKQDEQELAQFARVAQGKHKIERDPMNLHRVILDVGPEDWPFPVPIVEAGGKWSFDPAQGQFEIRARRVGGNELDTIEALAGIVEKQREYAQADRDKDGILEYAEFLKSSPGKTDGLFPDGPLAQAEARQGTKAAPFHGYYFRVLNTQGPNAPGGAHDYMVKGKHMMGGFALVAWPAQYGVTGVHTFVVNQAGITYEKDLGKPASNMVPPVRAFDPDKSWTRVD